VFEVTVSTADENEDRDRSGGRMGPVTRDIMLAQLMSAAASLFSARPLWLGVGGSGSTPFSERSGCDSLRALERSW
jgi:hypothetical protein